MKKRYKVLFFALIIFLIYLGSFFVSFYNLPPFIGISFSQFYAKEVLGLNWKEVYENILEELNPQSVILPVYWNYVEPEKDVFNFSDIDWQVNLASSYNKKNNFSRG